MSSHAPVLVTGFRPFDNRSINGAETVARALHGTQIAGARIETRLINVVWHDVDRFCEGVLANTQARMVLSLGEADRSHPSFETTPQTQCSGADVRGHLADGALAGLKSIPTRLKFQSDWFNAPETAPTLSKDAGAYLCNYLLMRGLHSCSVPFGFLHLPVQGAQTDADFLALYQPVVRRLIERNLD